VGCCGSTVIEGTEHEVWLEGGEVRDRQGERLDEEPFQCGQVIGGRGANFDSQAVVRSVVAGLLGPIELGSPEYWDGDAIDGIEGNLEGHAEADDDASTGQIEAGACGHTGTPSGGCNHSDCPTVVYSPWHASIYHPHFRSNLCSGSTS
jgi:hypothetical protein